VCTLVHPAPARLTVGATRRATVVLKTLPATAVDTVKPPDRRSKPAKRWASSLPTVWSASSAVLCSRQQVRRKKRQVAASSRRRTSPARWECTSLRSRGPASAVATGFDYLRLLAVSRIYLDNVPSIQASWVTQGLKMGQVALAFGANDMGSTMIEENVVAAAGVRNQCDVDEMVRLIRAAGRTPLQRDTLYGEVRRY
jgi:CofH/MqnC C-terminal region